MQKILVIGSSNTDLISTVKNFPAAGETIVGKSFFQAMGGKGANQAVAAHRLGGNVKFITATGDDPNGKNAMQYYRETGLDVSASLEVEGIPSGTAIILVDENGENCIIITPGANHSLTPEYIHTMEKEIQKCDLVMLQMEIPYETVKTVCEVAFRFGKKVMLNVAPARELDRDVLNKLDILVVNETEAETITGLSIDDTGDTGMAERLLDLGVRNVVLTLGKKGCILKSDNCLLSFPAFRVEAVDTTAAGDTFCGALAAWLSQGKGWEDTLKFATAASALCVTRMGAQPSIPSEKEVLDFLVNHPETY